MSGCADVVRRGYDALNRRDVDEWVATWHPNGELHEFPDHPDANVFHGHDGLRKWWREGVDDMTVASRFEVEDLVEVGERVLARVRFVGRDRRAGVPFDVRIFHVLDVHHGLVTRAAGYLDEETARAALRS